MEVWGGSWVDGLMGAGGRWRFAGAGADGDADADAGGGDGDGLRVRVGGNADFLSTSLTKRHEYSSSLPHSPLRPSPGNSAPHLSMRYSHIDEL